MNLKQKQFSLKRAASKSKFLFTLLALFVFSLFARAAGSLYDIPLKDIDGQDATLKPYAGKVLLLVNVASKGGFTPQYTALEANYQKYSAQGLVVCGFPCNQFGAQEPGTDAEIKEFCTSKYSVTFPMFDKLEVNGDNRHPLYVALAGDASPFPGNIKWNFTKFLIGRDGKILNRFDSKVTPDSDEVTRAIEAALAGSLAKLDAGWIPTGSEIAAPPADAPTIEPSKAKFLMARCTEWRNDGAMLRVVNGIVANEIDLSKDLTAQRLLQMGTTFAQEKCPSPFPFLFITVYLRHGDPATFTNADEGFSQWVSQSLYEYPSDVVEASTGDKGQLGWVEYRNFPQALKAQQSREAARAQERYAALQQQRQAEQKKQFEIAARSAAFVKANGVEHFVTVQQLAANPFVYQGQVVAIYGEFQQMNSATEGLFSVQDKNFVVSGIPAAKFTLQNSMVMLAGRVLGNIEIKLPVLGPTLVPHLSFVGSAFCQERGGSDYDINLK